MALRRLWSSIDPNPLRMPMTSAVWPTRSIFSSVESSVIALISPSTREPTLRSSASRPLDARCSSAGTARCEARR